MVTFNQQVEDAVRVLLRNRLVFTADDVTAYASLEGAESRVVLVLQEHCGNGELLSLDGRNAPNCRYMQEAAAEKWWVNHTLRWAKMGMNYLTAEQLAGTMSLTFDERRWDTPPRNLLAAGRRWSMVDDGCVPGTYVSPWASVLRANPHFIKPFHALFDFDAPSYRRGISIEESFLQENWLRIWANAPKDQPAETFIHLVVDEALDQLTDRELEVFRRRRGIGAGGRETLEQIAGDFGLTRERIRQIESKAVKRLNQKSHLFSLLFCGFAAYFIRSGGSLLIPDAKETHHWDTLASAINLKTAAIQNFDLQIIGTAADLADYHNHLRGLANPMAVAERPADGVAPSLLSFMSHNEAAKVFAIEREFAETLSEFRSAEAVKNRARMVYQVMRSLGRAAHYREIAEEGNRMFPDRQSSTHNWHSALMLSEAIELGVVWIGKKGMYGLREQGYDRPTRNLFAAAAAIVESQFAATNRPVSFDFVMQELNKERQDPDRNSVLIALGINDRVEPLGHGRYIPKKQGAEANLSDDEEGYDFGAAFDAHFQDC